MLSEIAVLQRALCSPADHFARLRDIVPVRSADGRVKVARTKFFAEAEVVAEGVRSLLFVPLRADAVEAVEQTAAKLRHPLCGCLCSYTILYSELSFTDSLGRMRQCDVILQQLPEGLTLAGAAASYTAERLYGMTDMLRAEMQRTGFTHNNLNERNIIVGRDGRMHLLRYHYARLDGECRDDFAPIYEFIRNNTQK